ncbi:MAG: hypothetical protein II699_02025 [Lachnospiraceae bacterium]|nr:hypothetical protein [Lachnospiraceae bacterium]
MDTFYVDGFSFSTREEYNLAVREQKNITSIRTKMDLSDKDSVLTIYKRLVSKNMLVTPIGVEFMRELRLKLINEFGVEETDIPNIKVERKETSSLAKKQNEFTHDQLLKEVRELMSALKRRNILIVGLIVIIVGMFLIAFFAPNTGYVGYEDRIISKYSEWEEELEAREAAVADKEVELGIDKDTD